MKSTLKALTQSLFIVAGLMVAITIVLAIFGQFQFDDVSYPDKFGIYFSALKDLPSYLNPLRQTLIILEGIALLLLPVCLFVFRRRFKLPITPWLMTIAISIIGLLASLSLLRNAYPFDDTVDSNTSWFLYLQVVFVVAVFMGQCVCYALSKRGKSKLKTH